MLKKLLYMYVSTYSLYVVVDIWLIFGNLTLLLQIHRTYLHGFPNEIPISALIKNSLFIDLFRLYTSISNIFGRKKY